MSKLIFFYITLWCVQQFKIAHFGIQTGVFCIRFETWHIHKALINWTYRKSVCFVQWNENNWKATSITNTKDLSKPRVWGNFSRDACFGRETSDCTMPLVASCMSRDQRISPFQFAFEKLFRMFACEFGMFIAKFRCLFWSSFRQCTISQLCKFSLFLIFNYYSFSVYPAPVFKW